MADKQASMRKRQQITKSGRTMFFWVAGISAVVGICAVIAYSLFSYLSFTTDVVNAKNHTAEILENNIKNAAALSANIQARSADSSLNKLKANDAEDALQVILDALPADANSLALGSSLQDSLLSGINGIKIEQLTVNPVGNVISSDTATVSTDAIVGDPNNVITFHLVVSSTDPDALKQVLQHFERSIRIINVDALGVEKGDSGYTMTIDAHAYYQPAVQLQLEKQTISAAGSAGEK